MAILNNSNAQPWMAKGRWYEFLVESNGSSNTLTAKDLPTVILSSNALIFPLGFNVIDWKMDIDMQGGTATSSTSITNAIKRGSDGKCSLTIPAAAAHDWTKVYVFGYDA